LPDAKTVRSREDFVRIFHVKSENALLFRRKAENNTKNQQAAFGRRFSYKKQKHPAAGARR
jgi:hypothetical protein